MEQNQSAGGERRPDQVVAEIGREPYRVELAAGRHQLVADEPASAGGSDAGPDPYALLLVSLGACKAMTVRMYADRKEWRLERATVRLQHDRIHAEDCERCETAEGRVDRIRVELAFEGDLTSEQLKRLEEIASRCPVHRTLEGEILIESRLTS